jgi:hypothetical protein
MPFDILVYRPYLVRTSYMYICVSENPYLVPTSNQADKVCQTDDVRTDVRLSLPSGWKV